MTRRQQFASLLIETVHALVLLLLSLLLLLLLLLFAGFVVFRLFLVLVRQRFYFTRQQQVCFVRKQIAFALA